MPEQFDLLIRNGWVVDGTGAPRFRADVGVNGERIVKVGDLAQASGKTEIDAGNKVIAPDKNDFADFAHPILTQRSGRATIRNSYMAEQHQDRIRSGWLSGKGPKSGNDIFEANTVRLQATYLHQPLTPGVGFVMRTLMRSQDTYIANGYRNGLVAIQVEQHGMMQSNPMLW